MQVVGCLTLYLIFLHGIKMKIDIKISMTSTAANYLKLSASCLLALNIEARELPEAESAVARCRLRTENPQGCCYGFNSRLTRKLISGCRSHAMDRYAVECLWDPLLLDRPCDTWALRSLLCVAWERRGCHCWYFEEELKHCLGFMLSVVLVL